MEDKKTNHTPDKKQDTNPANIKIESKDDLVKQAKEQQVVFGSTGSDDINKNLGHFTKTVVKQDTTQTNEIKLDADAKVVEQASKEKIDFEKFSRTKRGETKAKTKFGEKVSLMLRSKKGLTITWIVELVVMAAIMVMGAILVALFHKELKNHGDQGFWRMENIKACAKAGLVFEWMCLFPCLIPLIYLLTTWFIGINQVASSKIFHYMMWGCLAFSIICFLVGLGCLIKPMAHWNEWGGGYEIMKVFVK